MAINIYIYIWIGREWCMYPYNIVLTVGGVYALIDDDDVTP